MLLLVTEIFSSSKRALNGRVTVTLGTLISMSFSLFIIQVLLHIPPVKSGLTPLCYWRRSGALIKDVTVLLPFTFSPIGGDPMNFILIIIFIIIISLSLCMSFHSDAQLFFLDLRTCRVISSFIGP